MDMIKQKVGIFSGAAIIAGPDTLVGPRKMRISTLC